MSEIFHGSKNVYADLGFPDAEEMLVKAQLVNKIEEIIDVRGWTQAQAARVMGITQPKLSKILGGEFRGVSEAKLMECLTLLGRDVQIVVGPDRGQVQAGQVKVIFAA